MLVLLSIMKLYISHVSIMQSPQSAEIAVTFVYLHFVFWFFSGWQCVDFSDNRMKRKRTVLLVLLTLVNSRWTPDSSSGKSFISILFCSFNCEKRLWPYLCNHLRQFSLWTVCVIFSLRLQFNMAATVVVLPEENWCLLRPPFGNFCFFCENVSNESDML